MVKGVNKTVIEVNNTGSKVFDRIVFYVSPSCSNLNAKTLNRAIKNFTFDFENRAGNGYTSLRKRMLRKRRLLIFGLIAFSLALTGVTLLLIL